jgi:hypothetical protein
MFRSGGLGDELHALKSELSRLMRTAAADTADANGASAGVLDDISSVLSELGNVLGREEHAERPIASLASAFALGIAIGFMLRRH